MLKIHDLLTAKYEINSSDKNQLYCDMIKEIDIIFPIPKGLQKFSWKPHNGLNVITGLNGSGKTKLLQYIYDNFKTFHEIRYVDVNYKPPLYKQLNELDSHRRMTNGEMAEANGRIQKGWSTKEFISSNYLPSVDKDILRDIMERRSKFLLQKGDLSEVEAEKKWNDQMPWKDINQVFDTFGLEVKLEKNNLGGLINFFKDSDSAYDVFGLSSGERVAFALALWQWGASVNKKSEILLIDEFDAHLNPSLIKNYIKVIREHFVEKGVQVIMTTHNPLITTLLDDKELFWMEKGRIITKSKNSIANILADGLFSARDLQGIFALFGATGEIPKKILLTEGKNDELTLLREGIQDDEIKILDCKGAPNIPMFAKLPYVQNGDKKPTIICLFDYDDKGEEIKLKLDQMIADNNVGGNVVKNIFVSDSKGDKMEEVLLDDEKKSKLIQKIKSQF